MAPYIIRWSRRQTNALCSSVVAQLLWAITVLYLVIFALGGFHLHLSSLSALTITTRNIQFDRNPHSPSWSFGILFGKLQLLTLSPRLLFVDSWLHTAALCTSWQSRPILSCYWADHVRYNNERGVIRRLSRHQTNAHCTSVVEQLLWAITVLYRVIFALGGFHLQFVRRIRAICLKWWNKMKQLS